ncbi:hypothetical protein [Pseudomonas sp. W2-17]|uniref:hypothetical protein n=1 Tax=Pseudomonas sp. W2-17 TaxID=3058039 RepID=UPI0034E0AF44
MPVFSVDYRFKDQPRSHRFELNQPELPASEAAMHLLELHFGDSENSLIMPNADAEPDEIIEQAGQLGLTDIHVTQVASE